MVINEKGAKQNWEHNTCIGLLGEIRIKCRGRGFTDENIVNITHKT